MESKVREILERKLPKGFNIMLSTRKNVLGGGEYVRIAFSPNTKEINRVGGQFPQVVSLCLDLTDMELDTQVYGGNGGSRIYRDIDPNEPKEKYLAMKGVKVPFRRPKKEEKFVLKAIERFVDNYFKTLKDNYDLLKYKDLVDYSFLNNL